MVKKYLVGSMFAGIGGIDLGFQQAGFDIIWANELNKDAANTYCYNFGCQHFVQGDVRKIDTAKIPNIDVLVAGFPCQSFSVAGKQRGFSDSRGNLFFEISRVVKAKLPKVVFLENVANLLEHDDGKSFLTVYNALVPYGYSFKYMVMDAHEYGNVPQYRTRIFIVAFLDNEMCEKFKFPEKIELNVTLNDIFDRSIQHSSYYYYNDTNPFYEALKSVVNDRTAVYRIYDFGLSKKAYHICPTLTAYMGKCQERIPIILDDFGIRRITPYECLALQGFPKKFRFPKISPESAYTQCGNSVVVPVIRRIAENIMKVMLE